jgi:hypothetical protein
METTVFFTPYKLLSFGDLAMRHQYPQEYFIPALDKKKLDTNNKFQMQRNFF